MSRRSRWSALHLLLALPFVFAACAGEPTGLGDPSDGAGTLEAPGPSSSGDGDAGSSGSGESSGSEDPGESGDPGGSEGGEGGGEEPVQPVGETATGYASIVLTQAGGVSAALLADATAQIQASMASGKLGGLSEEQIQSIQFSLTGVQLHRLGAAKDGEESEGEETTGEEGGEGGAGETGSTEAGSEESSEEGTEGEDGEPTGGVSGASWVTVELAEGTMLDVDLTELPADAVEAEDGEASSSSAGLEIAAGELPEGTYRNVRLLGEATITFTEDLTMGNAEYVAGEAYPLDIPSSQSSGVKVKTPKFVVEDGGTAAITLVFDGPESIKKIQLKPGGAKMVPVMSADVQVGSTEETESPTP